MSEDKSTPSAELIKAGVEVVKTAYDDALQPVAKEAGRALGTVGKTVNLALAPLRGLIWGWERIEEYLTKTVESKLSARGLTSDQVVTPDPDIAVPAIEALRYSKLRDNYATLLATAMDANTSQDAHPAYVEILKQLTPLEAKILSVLPRSGLYVPLINLKSGVAGKGEFMVYRYLSALGSEVGPTHPELLPRLIDNLCRLGLTEIPPMRRLVENERYDCIRELTLYTEVKSLIDAENTFVEELLMLGLTGLGQGFRNACIGSEMPAAEAGA